MAKVIDSIQIGNSEINYFTLSENSSLTNLTVSGNLKVDKINFTDNDLIGDSPTEDPAMTIWYDESNNAGAIMVTPKDKLIFTNVSATIQLTESDVLINDINFEEKISQLQDSLDAHEDSISSVKMTLSNHTNNKSNPHAVTKAQVGLSSVVNAGQTATPASGSTSYFTAGGAYTLKQSIDSKASLNTANTWTGQQTFSATNTYTKDIIPITNNIYNIGDNTNRYKSIFTYMLQAISRIYLNGGYVFTNTLSYFNTNASPTLSLTSGNAVQNMGAWIFQENSDPKLHVETHVIKMAASSGNDTRYNMSFYRRFSEVPAVSVQLYNYNGKPSADWGASAIITNLTTSGMTIMKRFSEFGNFLVIAVGQ